MAFRPWLGTKSFRGFPDFDSFTHDSDFLHHTAGAADTLNKYPTDIIKNPRLNISSAIKFIVQKTILLDILSIG